MHTTTAPRTANLAGDVPDIRPHRATYRTVATEIQRSTLAGGWATVAVAEDPDWAATITAAMNWLASTGTRSDAWGPWEGA